MLVILSREGDALAVKKSPSPRLGAVDLEMDDLLICQANVTPNIIKKKRQPVRIEAVCVLIWFSGSDDAISGLI